MKEKKNKNAVILSVICVVAIIIADFVFFITKTKFKPSNSTSSVSSSKKNNVTSISNYNHALAINSAKVSYDCYVDDDTYKKTLEGEGYVGINKFIAQDVAAIIGIKKIKNGHFSLILAFRGTDNASN
ncbi:MAG: hypothetical protein LBS28_01465 [Streptococcaceae bacterium]|jgi:hypothetical protein|nr:hypothetical protein [Streptococcaceae bacterium]